MKTSRLLKYIMDVEVILNICCFFGVFSKVYHIIRIRMTKIGQKLIRILGAFSLDIPLRGLSGVLLPPSPPNVPSSRPTLQNSGSNFVPSIIIHSPPERPFLVDRPSGPMNAKWKNLYFIVRYYCREDGTVMGLVHGFNLVYSLLFGYQFYAMMNECTLNKTDNRKPIDHPFNSLHSEALRIPTFYSYTAVTWERFVFAICVSILFGVIHSVAWYYGFSTSPEKWGWRISFIIVSVAPLILLSMFTASRMRIVKQSSFIFSFFCNGFALAYICSRIALLLFPLIALRALPPGSYVDLDWATVIPHI